jgi:nucleoside-diphosphate-sugar epimerase
MKKLNVMITGGAGYKGVILTSLLLDKGYQVTVLDNFMYGFSPILHLVSNENLSVVNKDIRNITLKDVQHFDCIFHLAGISGMPACAANPHSAEVINVKSTERLVSFLRDDQLLIYASTTSFYGSSGDECDETVPVHPVSIYGRTKYEAENLVMQHANSISLRFATIFGASPKMRNDLLMNDFVYKAVNDRSIVIFAGHSKRTFVHIKDAIEGYLFALENAAAMKGGIYNVGDESLNFSKIDIANAIRKYIAYEIVDSTLPDLDTRSFLVSFEKIKALGYTTKLSLDFGLKELLKLYSFYKIYVPFPII